MSGFHIFNAHFRLYWGSRSEPDEAFISIAATNEDGEVRGFFKIYGWPFDTTGVLGTQNCGSKIGLATSTPSTSVRSSSSRALIKSPWGGAATGKTMATRGTPGFDFLALIVF
jgi:hypothetical protein